ncbi:hypothetical protein FQA39_LY01746 [Lamprigera yunnana]|nr:hypothetical protein FQA39_LY01746 [Lamprigera yunnana]
MRLMVIHTVCMSLMGLWYIGDSRTIFQRIWMSTILILELTAISGLLINFSTCNGNINCIIDNLTYSVVLFSNFFTGMIFIVNEETYHIAIKMLNELMVEFKTEKYTFRAETVTRRVTTICITFYVFGSIHLIGTPLLEYNACSKRNDTNSVFSCGLLMSMWFPFDVTINPGFRFAFVFQAVTAFLCIQSIVQPTMMSASIVYHIIGHLYMIQDSLLDLSSASRDRNLQLKHIIKHHSSIIEFHKLITGAFNQIISMYLIVVAIIFSISGFQMLKIIITGSEPWNFQRYMLIFMGHFIVLWAFSLLGQILMDQVNHIICYNINFNAISLESKMLRNKHLKLQAQQMAMNVLNYFGHKRDNEGAFILFTSVMQHTAEACGISINTLTTIKKRSNEAEIENQPVQCSSKRPRCKPKSVDVDNYIKASNAYEPSIYTSIVFAIHEDSYHTAENRLHELMVEFKTKKYTYRAEVVSRRITVICIIFCSADLLHYSGTPLLDYNNCLKRNITNTALTCGLPTPGWFPFDETENPGFYFAYAFEVLTALFSIHALVQPSMISASIIYHIIGQLYMIQNNLTALSLKDVPERTSKVKQIIKHHGAVIE